jgi:hypothetical protein
MRITAPFEFCENGAKAVAAESTSRRVTNNLFERYTVTELNAGLLVRRSGQADGADAL